MSIKLTELEKDFMQAICEGDHMYLEHIEGYFDVLKTPQVSGVVSSLIKKGLITRWIDDEYKMIVIDITDKGRPFSRWA